MTGNRNDVDTLSGLSVALAGERRSVAAAQARMASWCLDYADERRPAAPDSSGRRGDPGEARPRPGAFAADELSVILGLSLWEARCLLARTRRVRASLPEVWAAALRGDLDAERVREIDRVGRLVVAAETLVALDESVVEAARTRTVSQLRSWLQRFVARWEPEAAAHRHRVSFADRRVSITQSVTGMGYVTGEVSAPDAAAIDARLSWLSRGLGAGDGRTDQQRRSDLFAGLLLGTVQARGSVDPTAEVGQLEVEHVDPATGEFLGVTLEPLDEGGDAGSASGSPGPMLTERGSGPVRVGVVVPLSSLLGADETPGELADRSGSVPAEVVRDIAARSSTLFTRLLVDDSDEGGGRLVSVTELGRVPSSALAELVRVRAGACAFPTCTVPAARCDVDHHEPAPVGPTAASNLDPLCRRHHRAKTFAGLAVRRDLDAVEWTLPLAETYQCADEPLPTACPTPEPTTPEATTSKTATAGVGLAA